MGYQNSLSNVSMQSMSMAQLSTNSPNMTPLGTAKFAAFRNQLTARQFSSVKKDFMLNGGEEFTLDARNQTPPDADRRFYQELENAKKSVKYSLLIFCNNLEWKPKLQILPLSRKKRSH